MQISLQQWVLPPDEIGYEVLDVAEFDGSKEKEVEFEQVFEKKTDSAKKQDELACVFDAVCFVYTCRRLIVLSLSLCLQVPCCGHGRRTSRRT